MMIGRGQLDRAGRTKLARLAPLLACWLVSLPVCADDFQGSTHLVPFDEGANSYGKRKTDGPVEQLQTRLERGEASLTRDDRFGYLPALLKALGIPKESQMLVFSKTSFQRERIAPENPRALYFSDNAYVGFVPGSPLLEVATVDPKLGAVFYSVDTSGPARPRFVRTDQCLECHATAKTMGVPGLLVRSFETDESGGVDLQTGVSLVNHRTPMAERWGGWYVTGTHGAQTHRGNLIGKAAFEKQEKKPNYLGNLTDLSRFFDVKNYPEPGSDIVALMVLEHQAHMHNYLTRIEYEATTALQQYGHLNYLHTVTDAFLRYLLFTEEAPIIAPIKGSSSFTAVFPAQGPRDHRGRSLRDFNLKTRLFQYPCSYLIYSEAFDALPAPMKTVIYQRLYEILTGQDDGRDFQGLSKESKRAILEILADTKTDLPEDWRLESKRHSDPRSASERQP
jgi:hypothetical protein